MIGRVTQVGSGASKRLVDLLTVPQLSIATDGGAPIVDTITYINATFTLSGSVAWSGTGKIRGRGNSTWAAPKKPYRVKLDADAAFLLDAPASKDWVLLASYYDPSYVRTQIAREMARRASGIGWTPNFRFVEVTLNGVYLGLYLLGENVKVSSGRLNIDKMAAGDVSGRNLTGGWSLEIDQRMEVQSTPGFRTLGQNVPIIYDEPDGAVAAQATYIQGHFNAFESALYGANWLDPALGYARYVDLPSWADWYLLNELTRNLDSNGYSSIKLYKARDAADGTLGKIFLGPPWDFDNSLGNNFRLFNQPSSGLWVRTSSEGGAHPGFQWIVRLFNDPAWRALVWARWQVFRAGLPAAINAHSTRSLQTVWHGAVRDQAKWSLSVNRAQELSQMNTWLTDRAAFLDGALAP